MAVPKNKPNLFSARISDPAKEFVEKRKEESGAKSDGAYLISLMQKDGYEPSAKDY